MADARLPEATQAGRDQAEIDRPALGEQHDVATQRRTGRTDDRLTHGSGAYHRAHQADRVSQLSVMRRRPQPAGSEGAQRLSRTVGYRVADKAHDPHERSERQ